MKDDKLTILLEKSLAAEPNYQLPANFGQKVALTIVKQGEWKTNLLEYFYLLAISLFLLAVAAGIYYLADKDDLIQMIQFLKTNLVPVAFIAFFLNFIFFANKVLLNLLFNRWRTD